MLNIVDGLTYDDVLMVPKYSTIKSRGHIDLSIRLSKGIKLKLPIVPANMTSIMNIEIAKEFYTLGAMSIMHRFSPAENQFAWVEEVRSWQDGLNYVGFSVGVNEQDYDVVDNFARMGVKILCIDVAHGHSTMCKEMTNYISDKYPGIFLVAGNVCTSDGAAMLWSAGADVVKIGVGPGSLCSTRIQTGAGMPQLTAISDIRDMQIMMQQKIVERSLFTIADGGITNSGNSVKALAFSDLIMSGNLFAGAVGTPGGAITIDGVSYKSYVGSSTHKTSYVEGVQSLVKTKGTILEIMTSLCEGIRSGCSYNGVSDLRELKNDPKFVRVSHTGLKENGAHDVMVVK